MIGWALFVLTAAVTVCTGCHWRRQFTYVYVPELTITCPSVQSVYTASPGRDSVRVRWSKPRVHGGSRSEIEFGKEPGSWFKEGFHRTRYFAKNSFNKKVHCDIFFRVKVPKCPPLRDPAYGKVTCSGNKYGDTCQFSCNKGHHLIGSKHVTCSSKTTWSSDNPSCKEMPCKPLKLPENGVTFKCDKGDNFGSVCILHCDRKRGFEADKGHARCGDNRKWSVTQFKCKDVEAPRITNCPTQTLHQSADPTQNTTSVVWPRIKVKDNSGKIGKLKVEGPTNVTRTGGRFPVGTVMVHIQVSDLAGNPAAPCSFMVEVERRECDPPNLIDAHLTLPGCTPPFPEGGRCKVECSMDIPLVGSNYIRCTGGANGTYWDWGQHDTPGKKKPFCQVPKCEKLSAPAHGAIACDKWQGGRMCQLLCQEGFDVPGEYEKFYLCPISTGKWNSLNVPPCQSAIPGWGQTLSAAYLYKGPCSKAKAEVKANFIKMLTTNDLCSGQYCTVDNVKVTCGSERKKRHVENEFGRVRRGMSVNFIVFQMTLKISVDAKQSQRKDSEDPDVISNKTLSSLLDLVKAIEKKGVFTICGQKVSPLAVKNKDPLPVCPEGHVRGERSKNSCVPCPIGSFYNTSKQCELCERGSFQDRAGSLACVSCPRGHITLHTASTAKQQCQALCEPGTSAANGVTPCAACPQGTYQPLQGGVACTPCPRGMRTKGKGAKFLLDCVPFDVLFQGPVSVSMSSASPEEVCDFTLSLWVKVVPAQKSGLKIEVDHPRHGSQLVLELGPHISIKIAGNYIHLKKGLKTEWSHLALTVSREYVQVFKDGKKMVKQKRKGSKCPIPGQASMSISLPNNAHALVQSLNVLPSANRSVVVSMARSCDAVFDSSHFSVNALNISSLDRVLEVTPSTCAQTDACTSKPCGEHFCVPTSTGFRCVCKGGYSGEQCQEEPDFCKENQCAGGATCLSNSVDGYQCLCPANKTGMLCDDDTEPPVWGEWSDWGECSKTCGSGFKVRRRFCNQMGGDRKCVGKDAQSRLCRLASCPECRQEDLVTGQGVSVTCSTDKHNITCSLTCNRGLVFSEEPANYTCTEGEWSPDTVTQSCTAPNTPWTVGIKYSVLLHTEISIQDAKQHLQHVGSNFSCVKAGTCRHQVGVRKCEKDTAMCEKYGGGKVGSLNLFKDVRPGSLNLSQVLQNPNVASYDMLFKPWQVLRHESTESRDSDSDTGRPGDRDLQVQVQGSESLIFPRDNRSKAARVSGEFGELMSDWHDLDNANWEVRKNNYSAFNFRFPDTRNPYMVAEQHVTCPEGSVAGGLFCVKCRPGTRYMKDICESCPVGFYQDQQGQSQCKPCPGFSSTSLLGASSPISCRDPSESDSFLLMTSGKGKIIKINAVTLQQETHSLPQGIGRLSLHVYNPSDDFVYLSTENPVTIGRVRWNGTEHRTLVNLDADEVTGLAVDERSNILFFTLYSGSLRALTSDLKKDVLVLDGLDKPRDLVIDQQQFLMYWSEGTRVMKYNFGGSKRTAILSHESSIWGLRLEDEGSRLSWFSRGKLYTSCTELPGVEVAAHAATVHYGQVGEYRFFIDSEDRLVRINKDGRTTARIMSLPSAPSSVSVATRRQQQWRNRLCRADEHHCDELCWQIGHLNTVCLCARAQTSHMRSKGVRCWSP